MEKFHATCPITGEEKVFEDEAEAQAWVDAANERHPPAPCQPPAQVFTESDWEAIHCADAG